MFYALCRVINVTASIIYPTYASYKTLKSSSSTSSSSSTQELERWTQYWCIMGVVWIYQDWFEWTINWFPFYYELKTLFILWIVLPQIQGSSYIYHTHLCPFLSTHESIIDSFLSSLSSRLKSLGLAYLNQLIQSIRGLILGGAGNGSGNGEGRPVVMVNPGTTGGEAETNLTGVFNLIRWGTEMATSSALLNPPTRDSLRMGSGDGGKEREAKLRRKKKLELELAALSSETSSETDGSNSPGGYNLEEEDRDSLLIPSSSSASVSSRSSSSSSLRTKTSSTTLRKPQQPRGGAAGKRYVESRMAGSSFEDLGSSETRKELRAYRQTGGGGGDTKEGGVKGGWFGWGAKGDNGGEKKDGKGKKD